MFNFLNLHGINKTSGSSGGGGGSGAVESINAQTGPIGLGLGTTVTGTALSSTLKSSTVTLTNTNRTTSFTVATAMVLSEVSQTAGKFYFEVRFASGGASANASVGLVPTTIADYAHAIGSAGVNEVGMFQVSGNIFANTVNSGTGTAFNTVGNVVGVAVDLTARKIWFRVGSGNWNNNASNNPATAVGGITVPGTAAMRIAIGTDVVAAFDLISSNFVTAAPSGFDVWSSTAGTNRVTPSDVNILNPVAGDILVFNGTAWVNDPLPTTDGKVYARSNTGWQRTIGPADDFSSEVLALFTNVSTTVSQVNTSMGTFFGKSGFADLLLDPTKRTSLLSSAPAVKLIAQSQKALDTMYIYAAKEFFKAQTAVTPFTNPLMTSPTAPSPYVASASTNYDATSYRDYKVFDKGTGYWCSLSGNITNQWVKLDLGVPRFVHTMTITTGSDGPMKNFRIEWSDDNSVWNVFYTGINPNSSTWSLTLDVNLIGQHRYWRIYALDGYGGSYISLHEWELKGFSW